MRTPAVRGLSIRSRLLALVLVAALPVALLDIWSEIDLRQQRSEEVEQQVAQTARLIAAEQDQYLETARTVLATFLDSPSVLAGQGASCNDYLAKLHQRFPDFTGFGVASPDGTLVCSSNPRLVGSKFGGRDYVEEALAKRGFAIGDVTAGPVSSRRIAGAAHPLLGADGTVQLLGLLGLDLQRWSQAMGVASLPQGASVMVLDSKGVVMAHAPGNGQNIGNPISGIAEGPQSPREIVDDDGERRLYGFAPLLRDERLTLAVGLPVSSLYGEVDRLFWRELVLLLSVFVGVGLCAWLVADLAIRRPLDTFTVAIDRLRRGDLAARSGQATTIPEFVRLGQSFDAMASSVEQNQQNLRRANDNLLRAVAAQELLINELNHRVKNTLTTVQSIAANTLRASDDPTVVRQSFEARLLALSATHNVLTEQNWEGADLETLLRGEAVPYQDADQGRLVLRGQAVRLPPKAAVAIGMVFHELTTNAVKYGALSMPEGRVHVSWQKDASGFLTIDWGETGGPPVTPPSRKGFGSRLIERGLALELDGEVELDFARSGLRCRIRVPLHPAQQPAASSASRGAVAGTG
jgi:two-component sensor histidine kinase